MRVCCGCAGGQLLRAQSSVRLGMRAMVLMLMWTGPGWGRDPVCFGNGAACERLFPVVLQVIDHDAQASPRRSSCAWPPTLSTQPNRDLLFATITDPLASAATTRTKNRLHCSPSVPTAITRHSA